MMSRSIERAGGCYRATAGGNEFWDMYSGETYRLKFLEFLRSQSERFSLIPWRYVLMDNHYHLGLKTSESEPEPGHAEKKERWNPILPNSSW